MISLYFKYKQFFTGVCDTLYSVFSTESNYLYTEHILVHDRDNKKNSSILWLVNEQKNPEYIYVISSGGLSKGNVNYIKLFISKLPNRMMCILNKPGVLTPLNKISHYNNKIYVEDTVNYLRSKYINVKICLLGFSQGGNSMYRAQQKLNYDACVVIDFPISLMDLFKDMKYKRYGRLDILSAWSIYLALKDNLDIKPPYLNGYKYLSEYLCLFTETNLDEYIEQYKIYDNIPKNTLVIISRNDPIINYNNDLRQGTETWKFNKGGHCGCLKYYSDLSVKIDNWVNKIIK